MAEYAKKELEELGKEFKSSMEEAKNAFDKEKDVAFKKALKVISKIEKIFALNVQDQKAKIIVEKVKDEINSCMKHAKKKESGEALLNRSYLNAFRYFDIALKEFVENCIQANANIDHVNIYEDDDSEMEQDK